MRRIWVTWRAPGWHYWAEARHDAAKAYLAMRHRHLFHFRVEVEVENDDRDVEFHDLLAHCRVFTDVREAGESWGPASCEAIAGQIIEHLEARWPGRRPTVSVSEDGECGAIVTG